MSLTTAAIVTMLRERNSQYALSQLDRAMDDWDQIFGPPAPDERALSDEGARLYTLAILAEARSIGGGDPYDDAVLREARVRVRQRSEW